MILGNWPSHMHFRNRMKEKEMFRSIQLHIAYGWCQHYGTEYVWLETYGSKKISRNCFFQHAIFSSLHARREKRPISSHDLFFENYCIGSIFLRKGLPNIKATFKFTEFLTRKSIKTDRKTLTFDLQLILCETFKSSRPKNKLM